MILYFILLFFLIAGRVFQWAMSQVSVNLDEIIYTLRHPVNGTDAGFFLSVIRFSVLPAAAVLVVVITVKHFLDKKKKARWFLPVCCGISAIYCIVCFIQIWNRLGVSEFIENSGKESTWIEDNYTDPESVKITFPQKKRNLIYLYLESMEVSYSDTASGGIFDVNYIPELTGLAKEAEDFSGQDSGMLNGASSWKYTTWTMGGMFAATSGLPLKIPIETDGFDTNYMSTQDSFFPKLTTLGDILEDEGYELDLLIGSDATFGGRRLYYSTHGNYSFHDYNYYSESGELPAGYKVFWGFEDEKLFDFAKKRLSELSEGDRPFALTMLTVDTHYPDGYTCRLCDDTYDSSYANAIACSDRQVVSFLRWCMEQEWYEDTAIVISGDHPTMATFCDQAPEDYVRKVYTAYLNPAKKPLRDERREYSTVDNFPSALSAMGADIEGGRLGLGTDLFGSEDTLTEIEGRQKIDSELSKASKWMDSQADVEPLTADITYDPYDVQNHVLSFTIRNVSSDKVDGFRCCMRMYGYPGKNGSDYIEWISAVQDADGAWHASWTVPVDEAYEGIVKLQPTCMVDGARSNVLDLHYYHLKYDAGGGSCEWYECDARGNKLKE